jgi:hypothetical protein
LRKPYHITLLLVFIAAGVHAAEIPGTVGFQFLRTQVGARAAGLGGSFLAIPGDVNDIYYSPAGIATITERSATFTYIDDILDFSSGFVGFVQPKIGPGNLGAGILYKDYGNFDKTDDRGEEIGTFGANSVALAVAYALQPYENLSVGASAKYIRSAIDNYSADAMALDASAMYTIPSQQLSVALGLFNAGFTNSAFIHTKDPLPLGVKAGFSKQLAHLPLLVSAQIYKFRDEELQAAFGGEFTLTENLFLRLGYDTLGRRIEVDSSKDRFAGAAIGLGFFWNKIHVDYAFTTYGELGSLNRFTISGQL